MPQSDKVSEQLKNFFKGMGLSQAQIAAKVGTSQQVVQRLLNGRPFGKKSADNWAKAFGLNPAWLITGEGYMLESEKELQQEKKRKTADLVVTQFSQAIANEILQLITDGILYPANAMEEKVTELREKEQEIKRLSREVGALRAELDLLKEKQNG